MIESILLWILEKILNYFKKKYPDGEIAKYALIEIDKLDISIQDAIQKAGAELNAQDLKNQIITEAKVKIEDIVNTLKSKVKK